MIATFLLALQAAPAPDIELHLGARVREVRIAREGEARLELRAEPDAGSGVEVRRTPETRGARRIQNLAVEVHGRAAIADPSQSEERQETSTPDPR
jgi:hypothetical protein